jgi:hypothetical protein
LEINQQAVSFFVKLIAFRDEDNVQSILENVLTQEKLVINKGKTRVHNYVSISRYPNGTNEKKWNEEMSQRPNISNRKIELGV